MKIRLAKKIMKQAHHLSTASDYWYRRLRDFEYKICYGFVGKKDHRITKAINLSAKCKARDMLHNIEKNCCRTPFNQKNVESCRRKVESYKV